MIGEIGIVVPARDEARRIGTCLQSLANARARLRRARPDITVRLLVVLDRCTDATAAVASAHGAATMPVAAGRVGCARAAGCARLLATTSAEPGRLWLANTDADSSVPPHWLVAMLEHAEHGSDLVIGTVLPGPGLAPEVERRWHAAHLPRDGHPHVHGANLGIRASTYRVAGGWPGLATGEDELLVARAIASSARAARSPDCPVLTSTRFTGRAPRGFSSYLRGLTDRTTK